jgi:hypothetical protein
MSEGRDERMMQLGKVGLGDKKGSREKVVHYRRVHCSEVEVPHGAHPGDELKLPLLQT